MTKVLVVDDSRLSRNLVSDALTKAGYEVIEAINGQEGLEMYKQHQPDCIVTDLLMPVMTGQALLRCLRQESVDVPILVLSSDIQHSSKAYCESLGISGFLNKPVLGSQLAKHVADALAQTQGAPT